MTWLERQWQTRTAGAALLYPLSLLFGAAAAGRRALYRAGLLKRERLRVPVIIVGNIMAGGTGKTPLVIWLCHWLREHGHRPGIITRGYGGSGAQPRPVGIDADPLRDGDEAVLLATRSACPVWSGRERAAAGRALLNAHPECDVVVADDGLQHYALERDIEIAVVDGERGHGNGWLLPAGPLREPPSRLETVDAIVVNGRASGDAANSAPTFGMQLVGDRFYNLVERDRSAGPEDFAGQSVHAIAGIGHPQRFFRHLEQLGMTISGHAYPDHHAFTPANLTYDRADAIVMTEKDAVKCLRFATPRCWVLPVDADVDPALGALVLRKLESV